MYTVREARIHVRHIRDILKSTDIIEGYMGSECNSPCLLNVVTAGNILSWFLYFLKVVNVSVIPMV